MSATVNVCKGVNWDCDLGGGGTPMSPLLDAWRLILRHSRSKEHSGILRKATCSTDFDGICHILNRKIDIFTFIAVSL